MTISEIEENLIKENPNATMADLLKILPDKEKKEMQDFLKEILIKNLLGNENK